MTRSSLLSAPCHGGRSPLTRLPTFVLVILLLGACDNAAAPVEDTGAGLPDSGPAVEAGGADKGLEAGPWANVYKQNPTVDNKTTTKVQLANLTGTKRELTGKWADVYNCLPEESGTTMTIPIVGAGQLCTVEKTAVAGTDKSYLHIKPPSSDVAGDDAFAEVMMYHHINTIHDHYSKSFGLTHIDKKLRAIVNLQGKADLLGDVWVGVPNAAYVPKESSDYYKTLGIDLGNGEEVIVFGLNNYLPAAFFPQVNFSYDAAVIYHEYTHFTVGDALWAPAKDSYGLDPSPRGLNEALADYLPSSFLGNSTMGSYALGDQSRDLTRFFKCPDHIIGEEHNDGEIASGALWSARAIAGAKVLDKAIMNALLTFHTDTTFEVAAKAILAELKKSAPTVEASVQKVFEKHGMMGCTRLVAHKDYTAGLMGYSPGYAGTSSAPSDFSSSGAPAFLQHKLAVLDGTKEITIEYAPVSGALYGFGGSRGDVSVALQQGSDPITWAYTTGKAVSTAKVVLKGAASGTAGYKLVLSGDCIAKGDLVFQFINNGTADGSLTSVKVTQSTTVTNTTDNFTGC
jgi:hypothetical protein